MKIEIDENPSKDEVNKLLSMLIEFNLKHLEVKRREPLAIWCKDENSEILGGIIGSTFGNWLEIEYLTVDEKLRGTGIGKQLLEQMEKTAKSRNCKFSLLDTYSFQAKPFYEKNGYEEVLCIEDYPLKGKKHYLIKKLKG